MFVLGLDAHSSPWSPVSQQNNFRALPLQLRVLLNQVHTHLEKVLESSGQTWEQRNTTVKLQILLDMRNLPRAEFYTK